MQKERDKTIENGNTNSKNISIFIFLLISPLSVPKNMQSTFRLLFSPMNATASFSNIYFSLTNFSKKKLLVVSIYELLKSITIGFIDNSNIKLKMKIINDFTISFFFIFNPK